MKLMLLKNVLPNTVSPSKPKPLTSPKEGTPALSDIGSLDTLALATLIPAPTPAQYTKEDFQKITKLCIDLFF